jgi:patatin-like phospholipase
VAVLDDVGEVGSGSKPFRVLTLDGGGMRGVYQAAYLQTFVDRLGAAHLDVGNVFDLIVGTSTGALVACALAAKISPDVILQLYQKHGRAIFPCQTLRSVPFLGALFRGTGWGNRRGEVALRKALSEAFAELKMVDVYRERQIALAIPTLDINRHSAVVFKTPHLQRLNGRDNDRTLVDVCLASTAAPIVRSIAALEEPGRAGARAFYVDGGLWANNPAVVGMVEAIEILHERGERDRPIHLYALGTIPAQGGEEFRSWRRHRGGLGWGFGLGAISASLNAQAVGYDYVARKLAETLVPASFVFRFPAQCPSAELQKYLSNLDDARPKVLNALVRQAVSDVDLAWGRLAELQPLQFFRDALLSSVLPSQSTH